ncbi:MAG TPA: 4-alpha-glucanotransferase [Candidatus Protoclostridium stercorigallinarum]|uniref:4-alpha-glucanotransferase n=1 Tax=Candidatus Protoclostridium stercorigallinarum TaxID=2838741 RepID=A0A9D1TRG6_9FIRM|nr:4-alpha-glucanotransferase [Candidatus Protoclostridium stercorigallinarum]
MKRSSGVLLHIATLPCKYGIGQLGKEAYDFADFLSRAGQSYWQVLPLVPTGYGDSPYQSFCSVAGNEYFISLEKLCERGLLTEAELKKCETDPSSRINYEQLYLTRYSVLRKAFSRFDRTDAGFTEYVKKGEYADYALFRAIKDSRGGRPWNEWEDPLKFRHEEAIEEFAYEHEEDILFWQWAQYEFARQWSELRGYVHDKGIKIIGDIPIYIAYDSSECWMRPSLVKLDSSRRPVTVAGCPPDAFCETGQLWGNPVYDWERMKEDGWSWWKARMKKVLSLCDVVRIDHFRGFEKYYEIPYGEPTAVNGRWSLGPGTEFFRELERSLGKMEVIAEDLGALDDAARAMFAEVGYPGMKVLQFAFGSGDGNEYLPHNYADSNCFAYTGTHDNDTLLGFLSKLSGDDRKAFDETFRRELELLGLPACGESYEETCDSIVEMCYSSVAECAIIPMQDWLKIGEEGRINMPSVLSARNWSYRIPHDYASEALENRMRSLSQKYGR